MNTKYCVYIHKRETDSKPFYVGKGSKKRSRSSSGRSVYWNRIARKHGFYSEVVDSDITESQAFELEVFLIQEIGRKNLCNLTDGGEGCSGREMPEHHRLRLIALNKGKRPSDKCILASVKKHSIEVGTVCGLRFSSMQNAAIYLRSIGFINASDTSISCCVQGKTSKAYGFEWRKIVNGKITDSAYINKNKFKEIGTSCGLRFKSIRDVMVFIGKPRTNSYQSAIYNCIKGRCDTAYGYKWGYIENNEFVKTQYNLIGHGLKIKTSCGLKFNSSVEAKTYLRSNGFPRASQGNISNSLTGRLKSAYGFVWSYDNGI